MCRDIIDRWLDHRIDFGDEPRQPLWSIWADSYAETAVRKLPAPMTVPASPITSRPAMRLPRVAHVNGASARKMRHPFLRRSAQKLVKYRSARAGVGA